MFLLDFFLLFFKSKNSGKSCSIFATSHDELPGSWSLLLEGSGKDLLLSSRVSPSDASYPISSISRIFFNGTPVVLFTALFLKGCGHDFPWRISKREMAMYGESSFNALQLIFHFSNSSMMPLTWEKIPEFFGPAGKSGKSPWAFFDAFWHIF